jgi:alpha-L-fucosidase
VLEFKEEPEVVRAPEISAESDIFCDDIKVNLSSNLERVKIRYTLDYSQPTNDSPVYRKPIQLDRTTTVKCQVYRDGQALGGVIGKTFTKVIPRPADTTVELAPGLLYEYFHGTWDNLPDFNKLEPVSSGELDGFDISPRERKEYFGFRFTGYVTVPRDGVYKFYVASDDGSRLYIGKDLVVDNDGLHGSVEAIDRRALGAGAHPVTVCFFQKSGGVDFEVSYSGPGIEKQSVPASSLFHAKQKKR